MPQVSVLPFRLANQHLVHPHLERPDDVVRWLTAVQAQDYAGAKWALGLRMQSAADELFEQAFTSGAILRTHVMRPTWHFVAPEDIRWLLALTAPRVHALNATMYRQEGLDPHALAQATDILVKTLQGGKHLTRDELGHALDRAGISGAASLRLAYIMMNAELEGVICSGPRRGKQFTYALLEDCDPPQRTPSREEALAQLVARYFTARGPATVQDFAWWSGLTVADGKNGLNTVKDQLAREEIDGQEYWFGPARQVNPGAVPVALLLPNYDEYFIGYRNRNAFFDSHNANKLMYPNVIVMEGRVAGTWRRTATSRRLALQAYTFCPLSEAGRAAVVAAAERYAAFLGLAVDHLFENGE